MQLKKAYFGTTYFCDWDIYNCSCLNAEIQLFFSFMTFVTLHTCNGVCPTLCKLLDLVEIISAG